MSIFLTREEERTAREKEFSSQSKADCYAKDPFFSPDDDDRLPSFWKPPSLLDVYYYYKSYYHDLPSSSESSSSSSLDIPGETKRQVTTLE